MSVAQFLADLFESGRVVVEPTLAPESNEEVEPVLLSAESVIAANLAGAAPEFSLVRAKWAARVFYGACQFLVCRDTDPKTMETFLQENCPAPHAPQTDYSVDVVFQYLPELIGMTRAAASGDPLLKELLKVAREWPLSSVGVSDVGPVDVKGFIGHPGLRQLYVDRIIARGNTSRLGEPVVDDAVRQALGAFPELCTPIADHFGKSGQGFPAEGGTAMNL